MAPKQQPDGRYRGRRRLPKLPSARYAAVVSFAMVGAAVIAFGAGAFVPESSPTGADGGTQAMSIEDRLSAVDKANRSDARNGGGIIPEADIPELERLGVGKIFTPGAHTQSIVDWVTEHAGEHAHTK